MMYGLAKHTGPNTPTSDGKLTILDEFFLPKEAEFYSFRDLPNPHSREAAKAIWREMVGVQRKSGATFFRYTVFSDEYPSDTYPHGYYLEGWRIRPLHQAKFSYPLTGVTL
jgi:hypothetical protein